MPCCLCCCGDFNKFSVIGSTKQKAVLQVEPNGASGDQSSLDANMLKTQRFRRQTANYGNIVGEMLYDTNGEDADEDANQELFFSGAMATLQPII